MVSPDTTVSQIGLLYLSFNLNTTRLINISLPPILFFHLIKHD